MARGLRSAARPASLVRVTALVAGFALAAAAPAVGAGRGLTRVGRRPVLPPGAVFRSQVDRGLRLHITVTLRPRDPAALAAYARSVSTPGSAQYGEFLTPRQFGRRFGATPAQVRTVERSLRARGLRPGPVSAGQLAIPVTATAGQLEHAFAVSLSRLSLPGHRTAMTTGVQPAVAAAAAPLVQSVLGLDTTVAPHPLLVRSPRGGAPMSGQVGPHVVARTAAAGAQACPAAQAATTSPQGQGAHTTGQIASAYGFPGVYAGGDTGAGVTVAVYELEPNSASDIAAYQACYGTHASVSYIPVDGGAGAGPGQGEAALDIENLIGFAPDVHVLVYQGPNSNSGGPGSGPYDLFSAIINQDRARVVTVSWGECEPTVGQAAAIAENTLFEQAAVQGQSIVAADGDSGAQDCDTGTGVPDTQVAVDDPASQPYVTAVGGTTLRALGPRPSESAWNSGGTTLPPTVQPGASGGGVSSFWPMPAAQLDASSALGVRAASAGGAACGNTGGYCREVPDVAADADPTTGYLVYWNGNGEIADQPRGWQGIGGTSAAAPLWAALVALADGSSACGGSSVGFANPALYRTAGAAYAAGFNDVTSGNNDFTGTNSGQYVAKPGYDPVTGLGTPNAAALVPALCADRLHLAIPATQHSTVHTPVSLHLRASGAPGAQVSFGPLDRRSCQALPPGLTLNPATGVIHGRPRRTGRFTARVSAHDRQGAANCVSFVWIISAAPRISRLSLAPARGGARLALIVSAGRHAPKLQRIAVTLPRGLWLARARRGVSVTATGRGAKGLGFRTRVQRARTITITLRRPIASLRLTLAPPTLRQAGGRVAAAIRRRRRLALGVSVIDVARSSSRLTAHVMPR
ncbi:MAG TPA: protease pro-enzyme activation domain-containing protein [Solirubrobacteraceae bacterium]|nr:protease pro-enzyme activation domain-containing protein [Solirubrobacteraceae bacterium]